MICLPAIIAAPPLLLLLPAWTGQVAPPRHDTTVSHAQLFGSLELQLALPPPAGTSVSPPPPSRTPPGVENLFSSCSLSSSSPSPAVLSQRSAQLSAPHDTLDHDTQDSLTTETQTGNLKLKNHISAAFRRSAPFNPNKASLDIFSCQNNSQAAVMILPAAWTWAPHCAAPPVI